LFGRLRIHQEEWSRLNSVSLDSIKAQELLCYLALNRDVPHSREALASRLWGDRCTTAQSRKYLRNAIWQLQSGLSRTLQEGEGMLSVDPEWIELRTSPNLWLDVAVFEQAYGAARSRAGSDLNDAETRILEQAVKLYTGDLLQSWHADWCLYERERLVHIHIALLDKLMALCEASGRYEEGLYYGERVLRIDRAREYTHQQMMRLYELAGDRTGALRQFERCVTALHDELDVAPAAGTWLMVERLRGIGPGSDAKEAVAPSYASNLREVVDSLHRLQASLASTQQYMRDVIQVAEGAFGRRM
jgi:DNA-binding SARP family transcriptional activator